MDIMTEQFIPIVAFVAELHGCSLLEVNFTNHYFNIDGPDEERITDCVQMIDDFQTVFFESRLCLKKLSIIPN